MKAVFRSIALGALALAFMGSEASAQFAFMPLDYSIAPAGVGATVQYGRGLNDESGKQNSLSGAVTFGGSSFFAGAGVGYAGAFGDNKAEQINFGGKVGFKLPLAPGGPLTVAPVAGVNYWSNGDADLNVLTVPVGVTLAFMPPSAGASIQPFVTPYFSYTRSSDSGVSGSETAFAAAGGLKIGFGMLGIIVLGDYRFKDPKAFTVGGGIDIAFSMN
jgi:hypothetical protein